MLAATLRVEGHAPLKGMAEAGQEHIRFRTWARLTDQQLNELHRATIELDGQCETVLVEATDPLWATRDAKDETKHLYLTLRRNIAAGS